MTTYRLWTPGSDNADGPVNGLLSFLPRDGDRSPPPPPSEHHRETPTAAVVDHHDVRPKCVDENIRKSLTWNTSLADDQDAASERFLRMRVNESTTEVETFGPAVLTVPEDAKKLADELLKPSETYDSENTKVSWVLTTTYQRYLKSIPPDVLEKGEAYVLYPWTQWDAPTGTRHRPSPNGVVPTPVGSDSSSASDTSVSHGPIGAPRLYCGKTSSVPSPQQRFAAANDSRDQQQSVSSSSSSFARFGDATAVRMPSGRYCCARADTNAIKKVVKPYCTFCYKNREPPDVYGNHLVRDATGITCPKLRVLMCKHCKGTGDNAHIIKYCPFLYSNYG